MLKLVELFNRSIFVIDNNGNYYDELKYHGDIINNPQFSDLKNIALTKFKNTKSIKRMIESGSQSLLNIILDAHFILGGVWSPSKRELYFSFTTPSSKAKVGAITKIYSYKPSNIYYVDHKKNTEGWMTSDEFVDAYL